MYRSIFDYLFGLHEKLPVVEEVRNVRAIDKYEVL